MNIPNLHKRLGYRIERNLSPDFDGYVAIPGNPGLESARDGAGDALG